MKTLSPRARMDLHAKDYLLIDEIKLTNPNDRHVLDAAIRATSHTILTYNLSDFPSSALLKYEIDAQHPDEFLRHLLDLAPDKVIETVQETGAWLKNPPKNSGEYLAILENKSFPQKCVYLREYERLI
ncbi:MAG: hypothetical protein LW832_07100 [Parachlamydia sp.]|nr:hypothetical protein [Parachlamydia sp.]